MRGGGLRTDAERNLNATSLCLAREVLDTLCLVAGEGLGATPERECTGTLFP
jgi:hypothetical protein